MEKPSSKALENNKIVAAILLALLLGLIASLIADVLIAPRPLLKNSYLVTVPEENIPTHSPASGLVSISNLLPTADLNHGKDLLKKCISCHTFEKGGPNKVGPNQYGVVGSHFGHREDYSYSTALKNQKGMWDFETLNHYLYKPQEVIPGTKMAFPGLPLAKDRADLIAYLNTQSDRPLPLPSSTPMTPPSKTAVSPPKGS